MKLWSQAQRTIKRFNRLKSEAGLGPSLHWLTATILRRRSVIEITIRGVPIEIRAVTSDLEAALDSLCGEFDELIERMPRLEHDFIIDAGGYIGSAAIVFARAYPDATILSLEPSPANFRMLERNTRHHSTIIPINAAIAADEGALQLYDRGMGEWGYSLVADPDAPALSVLATVDCLTVEALLARYGKAGVDIIKLDIEGGEHALFSGNVDWIGKTKAICIELHDRVVAGASEVFAAATSGRRNIAMEGEKMLSLIR